LTMIMNENKRGGESYHLPRATSTTTSADNFFMDFVEIGNDSNGAIGSNETRGERDDYTTGTSSSLHDYDNMPFSSQLGFDFPIRESNTIKFDERVDVTMSTQLQITKNQNRESAIHRIPSVMSDITAPAAPALNSNSVPEFLYQLTKMLTENNKDVIEWSHGTVRRRKVYHIVVCVLY
jgi:hypothetical protein